MLTTQFWPAVFAGVSGTFSDPKSYFLLRVKVDMYRCRSRTAAAAKFVVSPITGEMVPVDEMAEHMRISLIDPRYQEQRAIMMAKIRETTKASDEEIGRNLMGLAAARPDVFGAFPPASAPS